MDDDDDLKINKKTKQKKEKEKIDDPEKKDENTGTEDDEFNVSLAKMEEEIKPKIINILDSLNKNYSKLQKYQIEKRMFVSIKRIISFKKQKF